MDSTTLPLAAIFHSVHRFTSEWQIHPPPKLHLAHLFVQCVQIPVSGCVANAGAWDIFLTL
jgi:hypothetical protein